MTDQKGILKHCKLPDAAFDALWDRIIVPCTSLVGAFFRSPLRMVALALGSLEKCIPTTAPKLDLENSFGWKIKKAELLDFMARYALNLDDITSEPTGSYFASKEDPGPRRAVENLRESSWWSMHLAETMWWISITTIILIVVGCVFLLNFSVGNFLQASVKVSTVAQTNNQVISQASATAQAVDASVIKVVTTAILFAFSYGLFRFTTGYFVFKEKSNSAREKADQLLEKADVDHVEAIKLWQEYHLAREASPTVPSWIWNGAPKEAKCSLADDVRIDTPFKGLCQRPLSSR